MKVQLDIRDKTVNPLELMIVAEDLDRNGVEHATIYKGNDCIWVAYGYINSYYIFREGKLVDIQID